MIEHVIALYDKNLVYARDLMKGLPEARLAEQPAAGVNHPAWIIGHLARTADFTLMQLNQPGITPRDWADRFGGKSQPVADRSAYPGSAELLAALDRGHEAVKAALKNANSALLDQPPAMEAVAKRWPVRWQLVIHTMTTHEMQHLGQLSAWRRFLGFPSVY